MHISITYHTRSLEIPGFFSEKFSNINIKQCSSHRKVHCNQTN